MSNYALRIPNSLFEYAKKCAEDENVSMNQFFVVAIAEKVSALKTEAFFRERAERADVDQAKKILERVRNATPVVGDELRPEAVVREDAAVYTVRKKRSSKRKIKP